jgi:hypothetical protein
MIAMARLQVKALAPDDIARLFTLGGREYAPMPTPYALVLHDDQGPVCAFGIASPWPGMGIAWLEERDQASAQAHAYQIGAAVLRSFRRWTTETSYRRIEAHAPVLHPLANKLLLALDFQWVATKHHYGRQGEAVHEYCWLPKE